MNVTCVKEVLEKQLAKNSLIRLFLSAELEIAEEHLKDAQSLSDADNDFTRRRTVTRIETMLQYVEQSDADIAFILNQREFRNID